MQLTTPTTRLAAPFVFPMIFKPLPRFTLRPLRDFSNPYRDGDSLRISRAFHSSIDEPQISAYLEQAALKAHLGRGGSAKASSFLAIFKPIFASKHSFYNINELGINEHFTALQH